MPKQGGASAFSTPWLVNIGLPRTGITSLLAAAQQLGLRTLHVWGGGEHKPELLERLRRLGPQAGIPLGNFHLLADTPFYALRETFERHYPDTRILCTVRSPEIWVESMLAHRSAGGSFMANYLKYPPPPHSETSLDALLEAFHRHYDEHCAGIPRIDLDADSDQQKWQTLIDNLPGLDVDPADFVQRDWPRLNSRKRG